MEYLKSVKLPIIIKITISSIVIGLKDSYVPLLLLHKLLSHRLLSDNLLLQGRPAPFTRFYIIGQMKQ